MTDDDKILNLPCWSGPIRVEPLAGGLSNTNYKVSDGKGAHVVRFGVDFPFHHVSREREVMVARAAHAAGFAPAVEYAASGVMVTAHLNARTFGAEDVRKNAARIGELLRHFHLGMARRVSGAGYMFWVFHVVRDYVRLLRERNSEYAAMFDTFLHEVNALESLQIPMPIIFGHHDLLPANFLDDGQKLWLIDFEYAGFGTAMFDLAGAASNAGMTAAEETELLESYLGHTPSNEFRHAFAAMACASLLRETLWAMVSGLFLAAPGVDYAVYTEENLQRYRNALATYQSAYGRISR